MTRRLQMPLKTLWLVVLTGPLLGIALGFAMSALAQLASELPWVPFEGPLSLIAIVPRLMLVAAFAAIGLIGSIVIVVLARRDDLMLDIEEQGLRLLRSTAEWHFDRANVGGLFVDGRELVVLGQAGCELFRGESDISMDALESAVRDAGFVWLGTRDPYATHYSLWIDGHPRLPKKTNALLRLRAREVAQKRPVQADLLRRELQEQGVVTKDSRAGQLIRCWRDAEPEMVRRGRADP